MKNKRTKACEIPTSVRRLVNERDSGCIFCLAMYEIPQGYRPEMYCMEIMHFVSRSSGGLGIPENLAKGCIYHHWMLDHSPKRQEMKLIFETYLRNHYPDWEESRLYYTRKEHNFAKREEQGTAQVTALVKEETGVSLQ